jgi:hypothetical protein
VSVLPRRSVTKQGKGAGAEKGDARRERKRTGQTRNSPGARRKESDEQAAERNRN